MQTWLLNALGIGGDFNMLKDVHQTNSVGNKFMRQQEVAIWHHMTISWVYKMFGYLIASRCLKNLSHMIMVGREQMRH